MTYLSMCDVCRKLNPGHNARVSTFNLKLKESSTLEVAVRIEVSFDDVGSNIHDTCLMDMLSNLVKLERRRLRKEIKRKK